MAVLLVQTAIYSAAPPADNWVLPNFAQRLDVTVTNRGGDPVHTLVTFPVKDMPPIALGFPGTLASR